MAVDLHKKVWGGATGPRTKYKQNANLGNLHCSYKKNRHQANTVVSQYLNTYRTFTSNTDWNRTHNLHLKKMRGEGDMSTCRPCDRHPCSELALLNHSNSLESLSLVMILDDCEWGGGTASLSMPHGLWIAAGDTGGQGRALDWATVTGGGAPKVVVEGAVAPGVSRTHWSAAPSSCCSLGSYCVFSSRAINRSSLSPNSPPISVGSPTTITSCQTSDVHNK